MNIQNSTNKLHPVAIIATFVWIGFVCAISFMEAWLKFQAPGITLGLGLGIGQLVFAALNKVEWVLAIAILINLVFGKTGWRTNYTLFLISLLVLILQTIWLLPALNVRAQAVINNQPLTTSNLHFYYVGLEIFKVGSLIIFGITLFKKQ